MKPLVSIVINNYNYGVYLGRAIESALSQTYPNTEVIVVDDGSTDDSKCVVERYKSSVFPLFKANGGQASAFNAGFSYCRGSLVQFLDSDDVIDPDCVERLVEHWEDGLSSIQFRLRFIDADDKFIFPHRTMPGSVAQSGQRESLLRHGKYSYTSTTGNMFSRKFLERALPIPEEKFRICADTYLQTVVPFTGNVKGLHSIHGSYRVHGANAYYATSRTRQPKQMRSAIVSAELRAQLITEWAAKSQLSAAPRIGDRELHMLSMRMINLRLHSDSHPIERDTAWRLLLWAILCIPGELSRGNIMMVCSNLAKICLAICLPASGLERILYFNSVEKGGPA